ncbi:MAG: hypothetical protein R3E97_10370 [Candidatus Eisenbacteria bacterium]
MIRRRLGPCGIDLVFLGGSAARGEAVGWMGPSPFALSDLDVGVVLASLPPGDAERALKSDLVELARDATAPEVTIGVYTREARHECVSTPGLVDVLGRRFVIEGDGSAFDGFPQTGAGEIEPWEAFRFVGNRSRELLTARASSIAGDARSQDSPDRAVIEARFLLAKLADGIGTAWLLSRREYRTERLARWSRLDGGDVPSSIRDLSQVVRGFLEAPSPDTWPGLDLNSVRLGLADFFLSIEGTRWVGILSPYEYDPHGWRNRYRIWRDYVATHGRTSWLFRALFRGTPEIRHLGAAVLYWLTMPEGTDPDLERPDPLLAAGTSEDNDRPGPGGAIASLPRLPVSWSDVARLLGEPIEGGRGAKDRLRRRIGIVEGGA